MKNRGVSFFTTLLISVSLLLGSIPAEAQERQLGEWIWDGVRLIWKPAMKVPLVVGGTIVAIVGGLELTDKGYQMYLQCKKGYDQRGIVNPYNHSVYERICAEWAYQNQYSFEVYQNNVPSYQYPSQYYQYYQ
ncbi:hypothetical protein KR51_00014870 [Rubidibacter lacunae KORDI 51-2]|uniref:Uncharacterized protein n=1 Tax=Rubidibacter lacunae KORDI 51-2 TaxID=582515 RepID=U5DMJ4_9CHRO|nr:hypothetical protein [Rubidibacter lacunae]ERN41824.1 hypothetical protein KR51_00014870 [Rubidibacter lacunae KORDI 51-2]